MFNFLLIFTYITPCAHCAFMCGLYIFTFFSKNLPQSIFLRSLLWKSRSSSFASSCPSSSSACLISWKCFHVTGLCGAVNCPLFDSSQRASNAELWWFLVCYSEPAVDQIAQLWWFETLWCWCEVTAMHKYTCTLESFWKVKQKQNLQHKFDLIKLRQFTNIHWLILA